MDSGAAENVIIEFSVDEDERKICKLFKVYRLYVKCYFVWDRGRFHSDHPTSGQEFRSKH